MVRRESQLSGLDSMRFEVEAGEGKGSGEGARGGVAGGIGAGGSWGSRSILRRFSTLYRQL